MRLYHGTTEEAYRAISKTGFCHQKVVWTCSDPKVLYFYRSDRVAAEYELNEQETVEKCFELALQSASCTAALTGSASNHLFVYEFLIDEDNLHILAPDTSTGQAEECCVCVNAELLDRLPHNVYGVPHHYAPSLALFYLSDLQRQDHIPALNLTELEELVMENVIPLGLERFKTEMELYLNQSERILLHENVRITQEHAHNMTI